MWTSHELTIYNKGTHVNTSSLSHMNESRTEVMYENTPSLCHMNVSQTPRMKAPHHSPIWMSHELNVCIRYSWVWTLSAYSVYRNHTSKMSHELMADMNESRTKCMHTLLMSMHSSIRLFGLPKPHIENESRTDGRYENASSLPHMNKSRTEWVRTPSICQVYRDDTSKKSHELKAHTTHLCHLEIHTIMEHKAFAQEALNLDLHQHRPLTQT